MAANRELRRNFNKHSDYSTLSLSMKFSPILLRIFFAAALSTPFQIFASGGRHYEEHLAIDWENYERTPETPIHNAVGSLCRALPGVKKLVFYGNWGGIGNKGGKPIDAMDELFRRHDTVYCLGTSAPIVRESDIQLVARLKEIDPSTLSRHGKKYQKRAIFFFQSPMSKIVAKPFPSLLRKREKPGSVFQTRSQVAEFFRPNHPGIPNLQGKGLLKLRKRA